MNSPDVSKISFANTIITRGGGLAAGLDNTADFSNSPLKKLTSGLTGHPGHGAQPAGANLLDIPGRDQQFPQSPTGKRGP